MAFTPQVSVTHYGHDGYVHKARWLSFWYHVREVVSFHPEQVLEVGVGTGIVAAVLRSRGVTVTTLDIDASLAPDVVASVTAIPLPDNAVDVALAGQVLEHLPWSDVPAALKELARVAKRGVVISLPDRRHTLAHFTLRLPFFGSHELFWKVSSRQQHVFDGQHHWELGVPNYSIQKFLSATAAAGLHHQRSYTPGDVPTKRFFVFTSPSA